jgi:hypothetical protein
MHVQARGFAGIAEPVADLPVLGPERQPAHAALWRSAEFRGFVNRIPKPGGIDLQIGCNVGHGAIPCRKTRVAVSFNDAPAAARQ